MSNSSRAGGVADIVETTNRTSVFRYPGSKSQLSPWIIEQFPDHDCYVEVFGGSGAVLVNKNPSYNEVFNDRDGDIVHFFEVLRTQGEQLVDWLELVPYSRDLHRKWAGQFYAGYRPDGDVERAGRFFYLRYSQFAQKYSDASGFSSSTARPCGKSFTNARDQLKQFSERLTSVQIENLDYTEIFERYDSEDTLFYADPPYVEEGDDLYTQKSFSHSDFANRAAELEGDCVISYTDIPDSFGDDWRVVEKDVRYRMRAGQDDWEKDNTERLLLNYDPRQENSFCGADQTDLKSFESV